jgi:RNA polymerase sigma factor (sigma-70 family)
MAACLVRAPRITDLMAPEHEPESGDLGAENRRLQHRTRAAPRAPDSADAAHDELLRGAARGDARARDLLTQAHLDWVVNAARARAGRGLAEGDLFQEGAIGLLEAIDAFASSGQADFKVFAEEQISRRMERALGEEERVVTDGKKLIEAAEDYVRAETSVRRELARPATDTELARKLEWSVKRTTEVGKIVEDARRRHDEELLQYLEPSDIDLNALIDDQQKGDDR